MIKPIYYYGTVGHLYFIYPRAQIREYLRIANDYLKASNTNSFYKLLKEKKKIQKKLNEIEKDERSEDIYLLGVDVYYLIKQKKYKELLEIQNFILDVYSSFYRVALDVEEPLRCGTPTASDNYIDFRKLETLDENIMVAKCKSFYTPYEKPEKLSEVVLKKNVQSFIALNRHDQHFINEVATYLYNKSNNTKICASQYLEIERKVLASKNKNRR